MQQHPGESHSFLARRKDLACVTTSYAAASRCVMHMQVHGEARSHISRYHPASLVKVGDIMPWPLALQVLHLLTITGMFYTHTRTFMLFKVPIVTDVLLKGHFDHFDRFGHFDTYNLKLITFLSFFLDLLVILPRRHSFKG